MSGGIADVLPLAPAQEGLYFHALLAAGGTDPYLVQARFRLAAPVDTGALRTALDGLLRRHPNLRACFRHKGLDHPVQLIPRRTEVPWTETDLGAGPPAAAEAELERLLAADRARPFDVTRPPLLRAALFRRAGGEADLVLTLHHILADGWSLPIIARELAALYAGGPELPPAPPYRDYLAWLRGRDDAAGRAAWRAALDGLPAPVPLPTAPATARPAGTLDVELPARLGAAVAGTARAAGCTPGTLTQVAWALVLARTTGRDDVVFGGVVSGRPAGLPGVESMVGLFLNTLPVRVRLRRGETLGALLRRVQREQLALTEHHQVRLADLQRDAGTGDLFDTVLAFENYPREDLAADGALRLVATRDATHYPLTLAVVAGERWVLRLTHRDGIDAAALAGRLVCAFEELTAAGALDVPADAVDVLPAEESAHLLATARGTLRPAPEPATVPGRFAACAARTPHAPAVVAPGRTLDYAALDAAATRLAARLRAAGVGPETPVALLLPRSPELVVAQLAVVGAGGCYVPLDTAHPTAHLTRLLADCGAQLAVTRGPRPDWLPADVTVLATDDEGRAPDGPADDPTDGSAETGGGLAAADVHPESAACLMYTSGTTGEPKGVLTPHRALVELAADGRFAGGAHRRVLCHSPYTFDAASYEVWVPLLTGGTVVLGPPVEPGTLRRTLEEHRVTALWLTAELFRTVAELAPAALAGLREVWCGGDVVPPEAVHRVRAHCPDTVVVNGYGPTETTVFATTHPVAPAAATHSAPTASTAPVPIGRPLDNMRAYVLDTRLRPVPAGAVGELYLAGSGLARGYLGRAGATAERFVADPYGPPGTRAYRTGDLARWTHDGLLEFAGRADAQVKVRGHRIEPGAVEAVLQSCTGVSRAVVTARDTAPAGRTLAAYLVLADGGSPDEVRRQAARLLPAHLLPDTWTVLDRLPLTPHGKTDRRALPDPVPAADPAHAIGAEPADPTERTLCKLFAEELGLPRCTPDTDFFASGGHSLLALRLTARIEAELGTRVPVALLFGAPTPAALAAHLTRTDPYPKPAGPAFDPVLPLRAGDRRPALFCLHSGIGLAWQYAALLPHLAPDRAVYAIQATGHSDPDAPLPDSVADLAEQYAARIRAVQPEGPYALLGHSLGGLLTVALADRLRRDGQQVALAAVLDFTPVPPDVDEAEFPSQDEMDQETLDLLLRFGAPGRPRPPEPLEREAVFAAVRGHDGVFAGRTEEQLTALMRMRARHIRLAHRWRPPAYPGPVLLMTAADEPKGPSTTEKAAAWRRAVRRVEVHEVRCTHTAMLQPQYAPEIAVAVEAALRACPAQGGHP